MSVMVATARPVFFPTPADFRKWLQTNHRTTQELWVGFYKKATGRPSITWPESVDEALCFGWIDGLRKNVDAESYMIRFTPRRPGSIWSVVNTRRMAELIRARRVRAAGRKAFAQRDGTKTNRYSFEREAAKLDASMEARFQASPAAWTFFQAQPPGYRRIAAWFVISAKQEATRRRRLETLIEISAAGERLGLTRPGTGRGSTSGGQIP
jgi:uncharacterized protein YdeI (YjbR/CyaY-like superfamily)